MRCSRSPARSSRCATSALLAQHAENDFVGMPCGVMDQFASTHARAGHLLLLDTRSLEVRHIPFDLAADGLALLVVDTKAPHQLVDGEYAARRASCEAAARLLGVPALRDVADLDSALAVLDDDVLRRRVRHVVTENGRVLDVVDLLESGDVRAIGPLLTASHVSLRDDYEVSCRELDLVVDTALAAGALGARMTGGGFGGSAIALVEIRSVDHVRDAILVGVPHGRAHRAGLRRRRARRRIRTGAMTTDGRLDSTYRAASLQRLRDGVDVLVVGGGVTGCGIALDAASRGLTVGLVEQRDFSAGTSSRSSKLVHGGLRYLEQFNFGLVREALRERALLLDRLAPHLVTPLPFLYPIAHRVWERPYVGAGLTLYDTLGGLQPSVPRHSHLSKSAALRAFPSLRADTIAGAIRYHDAQVDDARHTLELARTAAAHGASLVSAARVVSIARDGDQVVGARVADATDGTEHDVPARVVVNATGVWAGLTEQLAGVETPIRMRPSKGVHIVVPRDRIDASVALITKTSTSVLFVLPWGRSWIIGTTDTTWHHGLSHPSATHADLTYLLDMANAALTSNLTESDVIGLYAGLRPLVDTEGLSESEISREHTVRNPLPGLVTIAGGKYTTYRVMAEDAVDACSADLFPGRPDLLPASTTATMPLIGAAEPTDVLRDVAAHPGAHARRRRAPRPARAPLRPAAPRAARRRGGGSRSRARGSGRRRHARRGDRARREPRGRPAHRRRPDPAHPALPRGRRPRAGGGAARGSPHGRRPRLGRRDPLARGVALPAAGGRRARGAVRARRRRGRRDPRTRPGPPQLTDAAAASAAESAPSAAVGQRAEAGSLSRSGRSAGRGRSSVRRTSPPCRPRR